MLSFVTKLSPSSVSWGEGAVLAGEKSRIKARAMKKYKENMRAVKRKKVWNSHRAGGSGFRANVLNGDEKKQKY